MIPTRTEDDDEPDIIDLTISNGYYRSFHFSIRPPSPFADNCLRSCEEDNTSNGMVTWSSPTKSLNHHQIENTVHSSSSSSSPARNAWRRALTKFLKRTKSSKQKKGSSFTAGASSTPSDLTQPYNFGTGEIRQTHSLASRGKSTNKRVHWIDDDEMILNASHRFIEYLKLFVQNTLENTLPVDHYLEQCQIYLNELQSLIDCSQIKAAFDHLIQLAHNHETNQLHEQQIYIENLISRTVLFSSA